jgi:hypothetical protein
MFYDLISMLPTKKGGVPNAQKLRLKQYAPFRVAHTPLSPAVARELVLAVLAEVDNPVECVSKKERRAPNRLYAALLHTNYILHTPRVAWSDNLDVEHIIPYSTQWAKGTKINIHRLGNLTLLDHAANLARGATMLTDGYLAALPHSGYPTSAEYCEIVDKRRLISPAAYAGMCARREAAFVDTWVRAVFG